MNNVLRNIQDVLSREDVEGLLALGAPENEYHTEAELIRQVIESGRVNLKEEELTELLKRIWQKSFGPFSETELKKRQAALERVAKRLVETL